MSDRTLPEWAAEFDAKTWAQFLLKCIVSHPAVTVVRAGTTNPKHMLDDIGGGIGRLPNEAMRKRMAELFDSFPKPSLPQRGSPPSQPAPSGPRGPLSAAILDRYVGEYKSPNGLSFTFRRDEATLFVKPPGATPEAALVGRSEHHKSLILAAITSATPAEASTVTSERMSLILLNSIGNRRPRLNSAASTTVIKAARCP